ncbi:MAG TPA: S1C family serine protease [Burkholderiales bacterium]|nr:S1C family serine protease [Burkholderiales bacterium]
MREWLAILALAAAPALAQDTPEQTLSAVVAVNAKALPNARSAATLGTQRRGAGALIGDGYVLTIGYLVIESEAIEVTGADGKVVPATLAGYDHASGFGLLKLAAPLAGRPLALGDSAALAEREPALVATTSEREGVSLVYVVSRRAFTGNWEYQLDSAIFTYPAVDAWSGAPLIGPHGELLGIGSLIVPDAGGVGSQNPGNMFVPVELLKPILADLMKSGRRSGAPRPWLGVNADEVRGRLFVSRLSPEGPGERAGLQPDDIVLAVAGEQVTTLAEFYRRVWARGEAGVVVPIRVLRGVQLKDVSVRSIDRVEYFRASKGY